MTATGAVAENESRAATERVSGPPRSERKTPDSLPLIDALRFSGYSQIDFLVGAALVRVLGEPNYLLAMDYLEVGEVHIRPSRQRVTGSRKLRKSKRGSNILTSSELATLLYKLNPRGRYFDISRIERGEAVITAADVSALYAHHRFKPEEPFLSPSRNRLAALEFERTGVMPTAQYEREPKEWERRAIERRTQTDQSNPPDLSYLGFTSEREALDAVKAASLAGKPRPTNAVTYLGAMAAWRQSQQPKQEPVENSPVNP